MLQELQGAELRPVEIPDGLDDWLVEFIGEVRRETLILFENGAREAVAAREAVIRKLVAEANAQFARTVSAIEAASLLGRNVETVRRMVRKGSLTDARDTKQGHIRVNRGELAKIAKKKQKKYDPVADAQDVAKLRRDAA